MDMLYPYSNASLCTSSLEFPTACANSYPSMIVRPKDVHHNFSCSFAADLQLQSSMRAWWAMTDLCFLHPLIDARSLFHIGATERRFLCWLIDTCLAIMVISQRMTTSSSFHCFRLMRDTSCNCVRDELEPRASKHVTQYRTR